MKPLAEILPDGARVIVRPMDARIPYERSFVVEATIKSTWQDPTWPHAGLSPWQREKREAVERDVGVSETVVAAYVSADQAPGTSVLLGFASRGVGRVVTMVYVKRRFRGCGIGGLLLGGTGTKGDHAVKAAVPWRANRCWQRWVAYHGATP